MNKIFEVSVAGAFYAICAKDEQEARKHLIENEGYEEYHITSITEIPESEWDNKKIKVWEDNDFETEPYLMTYRECHENSDYPVTIATSVVDW